MLRIEEALDNKVRPDRTGRVCGAKKMSLRVTGTRPERVGELSRYDEIATVCFQRPRNPDFKDVAERIARRERSGIFKCVPTGYVYKGA